MLYFEISNLFFSFLTSCIRGSQKGTKQSHSICVGTFLYILVLYGVYIFAFHDQYCLCAAAA